MAAVGYNNKVIQMWERTRFESYTVASTVPSKRKLPPIQKWMPLPNDGEDISDSRIKGMFEKLKNRKDAGKRTGSKDNG